MKDFGEILKTVIDQKSSVKEVADYCTISERTLYRYLKGERKPDSLEAVEKLARFLTMDPRTKTQFVEAYKAMVVGVDVYRKRQMVDGFLKTLLAMEYPGKQTERPRIFSMNTLREGTSPIYDENTLQMVIQHLLSEAVDSPDESTLYIASGPANMGIFEFLKDLSHHSTKVEHLVALSVSDTESAATTSIQYLSRLVPLIVGNSGYRVYSYFTEASQGTLSEYVSFPEIIIHGDKALAYSCDTNNGILFNDEKMAEFFLTNFNMLKNGSDEFVHALTVDLLSAEYLNYFWEMYKDKDYRGMISVSPCTATFADESIIQKCVKKEEISGEQLQGYIQYLSEGIKEMIDHSKTGDVLSLEGIHLFLETGKLNDVPDNLYNPPGKKERYECMARLYRMAKTKEPYRYRFRFLKESRKIGDYGIEIAFSSKLAVIAFKRQNGQVGYFTLSDPGTVLALCDYMDNQLDEIAYSEEKTLSILRDILNDYSKKNCGKEASL